jgi:hypothetical protein
VHRGGGLAPRGADKEALGCATVSVSTKDKIYLVAAPSRMPWFVFSFQSKVVRVKIGGVLTVVQAPALKSEATSRRPEDASELSLESVEGSPF